MSTPLTKRFTLFLLILLSTYGHAQQSLPMSEAETRQEVSMADASGKTAINNEIEQL